MPAANKCITQKDPSSHWLPWWPGGFETPMRHPTVMASSEPSCPPWTLLGLSQCESAGQSVQRLPAVWGCPICSLQLVLGAGTWSQLAHVGLGKGRGKQEGSVLNAFLPSTHVKPSTKTTELVFRCVQILIKSNLSQPMHPASGTAWGNSRDWWSFNRFTLLRVLSTCTSALFPLQQAHIFSHPPWHYIMFLARYPPLLESPEK